MYDVAIIGGGPAGLSAALNCRIRNKSVILFAQDPKTTDLHKAAHMDNYLGFPDTDGATLLDQFCQHLKNYELTIKNEKILEIYQMDDSFALSSKKDAYNSKALILATGLPKFRAIKGEEEFLGKGVGYCATCDGPLFKGKKVAIVSTMDEGEKEANFLAELAEKVYYIPLYKGDLKLAENIDIIRQKPQEVKGNLKAEYLVLEDQELHVDGIFFLRESVQPSQLIAGLEFDKKAIKVDRDMATNIEGVYAAGDCTGKPLQVAKAVGEGQVAGLSAVSFLDGLKQKNK
ncbi:NAD(P)/FAD-dependent oxidoreductase [Proteinivorax hydrogeniformans]|uniref:NAD(P)/FAD-dependent oxidoreductase n=1 Tax=Proteinivorax hydrogeniformans TaxID=1826727 RepID=A0AAU8HPU2_9FIRM